MTAVFHKYGTFNAWVLVEGNHTTVARVYEDGMCNINRAKIIQSESIHLRGECSVVMHMNNGNSVNETAVSVNLNLETLRLAAELLGYSLKKME